MKTPKYCINRDLWIILPDGEVHWCTVVRYDKETRQYVVTIDLADTTGNSTFTYNEEDLYETYAAAWNAAHNKKEKQIMNKPCKYTAGQTVWTILGCDHVECTILRTGNDIAGDPEYLLQPIKSNGHFENTYWMAEDLFYDNELDAVKKSLQLWDNKHKKAVEDADYILSHKLAYLSLRKSELEEQQRKSLDSQTLTNGYYEVPADKCYSSVTVQQAAKLGVIGGMVEDLHICNGGIVHLRSGRLESAAAYKGAQLTVDGGYVHSACIAGGSLCVVGSKGKMPYVERAVVEDGGDAYLCSAIGSGFWVREPKSRLRIASGATAIETIIGSSGEVSLSSGASMSRCTVCSGGTLTLYGDDVSVNDLTINNGGIVRYVEAKR